MGVGVGWRGSLPGLSSRLVPVVSLHVGMVLVRVVAFLASEVVLSLVVSGCVPSCGMGVGWCGSLPLKSSCLPLSRLMGGLGVGSCGSPEVVLSPLFLPVSPFMWGRVLVGVVASLGSDVVCHL